MSRTAIYFGLGNAVVVTAGFIVAMSSMKSGPSPLSDELLQRLGEVEQKLAIVAALEVPATVSVPVPARFETPRDEDRPDEVSNGDDEEDSPETDSELERVLSKLDDIDRRLGALEQDPIARGFAFVDSTNADLRKRGILQLASLIKHDPQARETVRNLVNDPVPSVRATALDALSDNGDKDSIALFLAALEDEDAGVRREAVDGILDMDVKEHALEMAQLINDPNDTVRRDVANAIGELGFADGREFLLTALQDKNDEVKGQAISSLGEIGSKESAPLLRKMFDENPGRHKWRLAVSLKTLGDAEPYQGEVNRLSSVALDDQNERSRRDALRTLSSYARTEAKTVFEKALEDPSRSVRETAQWALRGRRGR